MTFKQSDTVQDAFGSNLIGAVFVGILEYSSLVIGIRLLHLIALLFYMLWFGLEKI